MTVLILLVFYNWGPFFTFNHFMVSETNFPIFFWFGTIRGKSNWLLGTSSSHGMPSLVNKEDLAGALPLTRSIYKYSAIETFGSPKLPICPWDLKNPLPKRVMTIYNNT